MRRRHAAPAREPGSRTCHPAFAHLLIALVAARPLSPSAAARCAPTARSRCSSTTCRSPATTSPSAPSSWRSPARRAARRPRLDQLIDEAVEMLGGQEARLRRFRRARRRGLRLDRQKPEADARAAGPRPCRAAGHRADTLKRRLKAQMLVAAARAGARPRVAGLGEAVRHHRAALGQGQPRRHVDDRVHRSSRSFSSCRRVRRPATSRSGVARRRPSASASRLRQERRAGQGPARTSSSRPFGRRDEQRAHRARGQDGPGYARSARRRRRSQVDQGIDAGRRLLDARHQEQRRRPHRDREQAQPSSRPRISARTISRNCAARRSSSTAEAA